MPAGTGRHRGFPSGNANANAYDAMNWSDNQQDAIMTGVMTSTVHTGLGANRDIFPGSGNVTAFGHHAHFSTGSPTMHHYSDHVYLVTSGARVGDGEATGAQPFVMVGGATSQYNDWLGNASDVDQNSTGGHWYQSNGIGNAGSMRSDEPAYQNNLYDGASEAYSSVSTSLFTPDSSTPRTSSQQDYTPETWSYPSEAPQQGYVSLSQIESSSSNQEGRGPTLGLEESWSTLNRRGEDVDCPVIPTFVFEDGEGPLSYDDAADFVNDVDMISSTSTIHLCTSLDQIGAQSTALYAPSAVPLQSGSLAATERSAYAQALQVPRRGCRTQTEEEYV